jgi:hypothetical protein
MAMEILIPKGFRKIAVRETNAGVYLCEVFFNADSRLFFIRAGDKAAGPLDKAQMEAIKDAINDTLWMKGRFNYIDD